MITFVPFGNSFTLSQNAGPSVVFRNAPDESTKFTSAAFCVALQCVESAVIPPMRISGGTPPVRCARFCRSASESVLGAEVLPMNSSKKAVSMLKLARAGLRVIEAVDGRDGGPG